MTTPQLSRTEALVPQMIHRRSLRWPLETAVVLAGVAVVAALAKVSFFVGPVPITGQTLGVLLVGAAYGAARGAVTMTTYMLVGLAGAPVFSGASAGPASVMAPSFGFIVGFIPCAWLVGWFAQRGCDRSVVKGSAINALASVIPFLIGVPYMVVVLALTTDATPTFAQAMEWGVLPFIPGGIIKAVLAACALPVAWSVRRRIIAAQSGGDSR